MAVLIDGKPMTEVLEASKGEKPVKGKVSDMSEEKKAKKTLTKEERIEAIKAKRKQLDARIAKLEARDKEKERKNDTRKKIIIGGVFSNFMKSDEAMKAKFKAELSKLAERDKDLFKDF